VPLLGWYDRHARQLPWRESPDPYRVWVSEIMLQQTRVDTVIPYFERWLRLFPDVRTLAAAPSESVLKAWEGLGYYRRARNMHLAAQRIVEQYDGEFPADIDALRKLPGVGEYTAGAIASIAFGARVPAVDGNVRRVLCRLFDLPDPGMAELRSLATSLVPEDRPGDFNQAMMELGATVCTPRGPRCAACPVAPACLARARGTQAERPGAAARAAIPEFDVACAILLAGNDTVLLVRRPEDGLLGGLWAFPETTIEGDEPATAAAIRLAEAMVDASVHPTGVETKGVVRHAFTHRLVRYHPVLVRFATNTGRGDGGATSGVPLVREVPARYAVAFTTVDGENAVRFGWFGYDEAGALAMPVAHRKILGAVSGAD